CHVSLLTRARELLGPTATRNTALGRPRRLSPERKHACESPLSAIRRSFAPGGQIRALPTGMAHRSLPLLPHGPCAPRPTSLQILVALFASARAADASTTLRPNGSAASAVGIEGSRSTAGQRD